MNRNEMKVPEGAESGLLLDFPREHKPEKSMKKKSNEGNSDLQQLEQAIYNLQYLFCHIRHLQMEKKMKKIDDRE